MAPALVGFAVFFVYPLLAPVYYSFTRFDLLNPPVWVGLRQLRFLLGRPAGPEGGLQHACGSWSSSPCLRLVCRALGVAACWSRAQARRGVFRTLFYLPALAPPVAATLAFVFLLKPGTGPVNTLLAGSASTARCGSTTPRGPSPRWSCWRCGASAT